MNTFDKIKSIFTSIPIVYYLLFFVIIICIHLYTNYSLQVYNSKIKKNSELEDNVLFKEHTVRYRYNILKGSHWHELQKSSKKYGNMWASGRHPNLNGHKDIAKRLIPLVEDQLNTI